MNQQQVTQFKGSILVVDDTPVNLNLLMGILSKQGYEVSLASSGQLALEAVDLNPPDLILLDIMMPELNGYQVCENLKSSARTKDIPVIFISALDELMDKVKAFSLGGVDYITKPFQVQEVLVRIENQLSIRRLSQQLSEENLRLQQEIKVRQQVEEALRESAIKLLHQNLVLMELARDETLHQGDLKTAFKTITEATARNIQVERVSVWLYDQSGNKIKCVDLFEQSLNQHSAEFELAKVDYPSYFQALIEEQLIIADDAYSDSLTKEFSESYLLPFAITSMLDAPIRIGGQTVGVLCSEQVGVARHWTAEDQNFVRSVADLVSLALEARERKRAQEEIRSVNTFLDSIIENIPHMICVKDASSLRFVRFNKAGEELFGYSRQELTGKNDFDFLPPEQANFCLATDLEVLASGKVLDIPEQPMQTRSKGLRILHTKKIRILDAIGKPHYLLSISEDITERKQAEEDLRQSEAREREKATQLELTLSKLKSTQLQLIQTEKMSSLGQMIAGIAHEINNPVSFISGNLTYARRYFQDLMNIIEIYHKTYPDLTPEIQQLEDEIDLDFILEDLSKLMASMQVGADRIYDIVRSLRSFYRLDESEFKAVDIHEGIDNTLLILKHRLRAGSDRPEIQLIKEYGKLPAIACHPNQLNQVFMNLLTNAIDALEEKLNSDSGLIPTITISTSVSSEFIGLNPDPKKLINPEKLPLQAASKQIAVIRIADNGPGMNKQVYQQIFDPFFTTKPVGSGTGLGLSISYQIVVEKHGGQLSCVSTRGKGTEFIVEIPIREQANHQVMDI